MTNKLMLRRRHIMLPESASASGRIVSFKTLVPRALRGLTAQIEPLQAGSGNPSPDNIRPISGWTGMNLCHAGKNLLKTTLTSQTFRTVEIVVNDDGTVRMDGTLTGGGIGNSRPFGTVTLPPGTYSATGYYGASTATNTRMQVGDLSAGVTYAQVYSGDDKEFTLTDTATLTVYPVASTGVEIHATWKPMIRRIGDATFRQYLGEIVPISWQAEAGTVYGGTLNLATGLLTVTHGYVSGITLAGTWPVLRFDPLPNMASGAWYTDDKALCNALPKVQTNTEAGIRFGANNGRCYLYNLSTLDPSITSRPTAQAWADEVGLAVTYPLAEPLTYQLTPQQVAALAGENNIWTDVGDISVIYRA